MGSTQRKVDSVVSAAIVPTEASAPANARSVIASASLATTDALATMTLKAAQAAADLRPAAVLFSPPFPRAVPLVYELLESAEHERNRGKALRQQAESEPPGVGSGPRFLGLKNAAAATAVGESGSTGTPLAMEDRSDAGLDSSAVGGATPAKGIDVYPLVVVLHGMFRCRDSMKALCARLNADQVVAADLRNHGDSPFSRTMFMQDMAADVLLLLQRLRVRFPHISRCCLVGHSLGGQVAMAAAIRTWYSNTAVTASQYRRGVENTDENRRTAAYDRVAMRVQGVVALDICPVNYYRWPLPAAGPRQQNVRDLVELIGNIDLKEVEEQLRQQRELLHRSDNNDACWEEVLGFQPHLWKSHIPRSFLGLLVEDSVGEANTRAQGVAKSSVVREGEPQPDTQQHLRRELKPSNIEESTMRQQQDERQRLRPKVEAYASTGTTTKSKLRWRMNVGALQDAFRSETLKWDVPLPVRSSDSAGAACAAVGYVSSPAGVPSAAITAGKPAVDSPAAGMPGNATETTMSVEREYVSVAGFKEPPYAATCGREMHVLIVRGECSPWVDVGRHWKDVTAFFPHAQLQTVPASGHAVHEDELDRTAAAINRFLDELDQSSVDTLLGVEKQYP